MTLGTKLFMSLLSCGLVVLWPDTSSLASGGGPDGSADQAVTRLQEGNARFVAGKPVHPHTTAARIANTFKEGQHPYATVITCSDSRVPVERVFDQGVGDLFVIRVAGNVCDADEVGSIEYGVDHLETPLMVVLGHTHCGAVTAVVTNAELHGNIPQLVDNIEPAVAKARQEHPNLSSEALVAEAVKANVWQSINDLYKRSPATRKRVSEGKLKVIGAVYEIETGKIEWLGTHPEDKRLAALTGDGGHADKGRALPAHGSAQSVADSSRPGPHASPAEAISFLKEGNERYRTDRCLTPRRGAGRRQETAREGQYPLATVITCSDSRVPVEVVFDQGVGDIFVIRVAGNVCNVDEIGSIEYGVDHLRTPLLVVLGHTGCGAVTAVVTNAELHGSIPPLVQNIRSAVNALREKHPDLGGKDLVHEAVEANVWESIGDLLEGSPATRELVRAGELKILGAVYNLADGKVQWLGTHPDQSRLLACSGDTGKQHALAAGH